MTAYTDTELAAVLSGGKSHLAARKRSVFSKKSIRRQVCAFANDLPDTGTLAD